MLDLKNIIMSLLKQKSYKHGMKVDKIGILRYINAYGKCMPLLRDKESRIGEKVGSRFILSLW